MGWGGGVFVPYDHSSKSCKISLSFYTFTNSNWYILFSYVMDPTPIHVHVISPLVVIELHDLWLKKSFCWSNCNTEPPPPFFYLVFLYIRVFMNAHCSLFLKSWKIHIPSQTHHHHPPPPPPFSLPNNQGKCIDCRNWRKVDNIYMIRSHVLNFQISPYIRRSVKWLQ